LIWVRSLAFTVAFYAMSTVVALLMIPLFVMPRRWTTAVLMVWGHMTTILLRLVCGVKVEVRGRENLPRGAALIAAKHQCMFDIFGSFAFLPDACFVLKKELMVIPFFGWYAVKAGMIVVDRDAGASAVRKLVADARDRFKDARQLVIFPEGTRKAPGEAPDYKPGIAGIYRDLGDMPVIPLALNTGVHWPAHGFLRHPGTIVFEFLPAIPAGLKRGEFMRELETRIETASNALVAEGV
jgi:1-acyl-sn-glycerol-3-phosphate acyltransferase